MSFSGARRGRAWLSIATPATWRIRLVTHNAREFARVPAPQIENSELPVAAIRRTGRQV
jgi:hypothetical protein